MKRNAHPNQRIEGFLTIAIFAVLALTVLEEAAVLAHAGRAFMDGLTVAGFLFDLLFTVEFLARFFSALAKGEARDYIAKRLGWIDFLASIPLLVLVSGPAFYALLAGSSWAASRGALGLLKALKSVRVARVLRMLRALKLARSVKFADSVTAQRLVVKAITIGTVAYVSASMLLTTASALGSMPGLERGMAEVREAYAKAALAAPIGPSGYEPPGFVHPELLLLREGEVVLYARPGFDPAQYAGEVEYYSAGGRELVMGLESEAAERALFNLFSFIVILFIFAGYLAVFGPFFATRVSDPVNVVRKGLEEPDYHLEAKIPEADEGDDVARLARAYNEAYLPIKGRGSPEQASGRSVIGLEGFDDLLGGA
jgi:hypothetical protein